ncbi:MAG: DUF4134 domain-containing protein [Prevotellaceae bacterium]|jgi:hypothetical protein|nr:DUF4134 domain-containing protein [Prevotellaceae bacterium]
MIKSFFKRGYLLAISMVLFAVNLFAQGGGAAGLSAAEGEIKTMFDPASKLILAIGAVVGLIGGIRCYIKWNTGDQDVMKSVMGWGGACIFLVVVALVIKAFFGV